MRARAAKNPPGRGWKPSVWASGVAGSSAPAVTTPRAARVSGRLGWLRRNGIRRVRMAKMTRVWVARDSTNQPVRNWAGPEWNTHSMTAKVGATAGVAGRRHGQPDLGTRAWFTADLGPAAVALHASDDRAAYAMPIILHSGHLEAGATVPDEHLDRVRLDLGVQRDRRHLGVPACVDQRLAGRGHDGPDPFVDLEVAHHHGLDGDRVGVLDFRRGLLQRGREAFGRRGGGLVEPVAQRPLLAPDARLALGAQGADHPPEHRRGDQADSTEGQQCVQQPEADRAQPGVGGW